MDKDDAIKQVLREASDHASFAGWSFAERLIWMIGRGFALGEASTKSSEPGSVVECARANAREIQRKDHGTD